jgi:hypothetical protein
MGTHKVVTEWTREGDHGIIFEPVEDADDSPPDPGSQCCRCRHFVGSDDPAPLACKAFSSRIPAEIFANLYDHREPCERDDGVRFEPNDEATADELANLRTGQPL